MTRNQASATNGVRRRRLLVWSAVPVLLLLVVAAKLVSVPLLANQAARAFEAGDSRAVQAAADGLGVANFVELHKAPFAAGDARVLAGDFPAARLLFEEALAAVPQGSADECAVRVNLSLAIETMGDGKRTEDPSSAASLYAEALAITEHAPYGCFSGANAPASGEQLRQAEDRLKGKLAASAQPDEAQGSKQEDNSDKETSLEQSQLEQLEESARQAQRERNAGREREEYLNDTDYGSGPDRPW